MPRTLPNDRAYQRPTIADTASATVIVAMNSVDLHDSGTGELWLELHAATRRAAPSGIHRSPCQKKKFAVMALMRSSAAVSRIGMYQLRLVCTTNWCAMHTSSRGDFHSLPNSRFPTAR